MPTKVGGDYFKRGLMTPPLTLVHDAFKNQHITLDEAQDLNPKYTGLHRMTVSSRRTQNFKREFVEPLERGVGRKPGLPSIHAAVTAGHIDREQGKELNSEYTGENPRSIQRRRKNSQTDGKTPKLTDVYRAVSGGHITEAEGEELNPKYSEPVSKINAANNVKYRPLNNKISRQFTGSE